jgi:hypothetical protein
MALTGPSGSGKTLSALLIAKGLGSKIAVVDTEAGSASHYAGRPGCPEFDVLELRPPYTTDKYIEAIRAAQSAGYDVLVIDSLSHQWAGEGGLLQRKEQLDARGGNSYTNWAKMTPEHERLKAAVMGAQMDVVCTMRSKQDYALVENEKGKQAPKKIGLAPIQRDGFEYEFSLVLDIDMSHQAMASKDRTGLFDKEIFVPTEDTGKRIRAWIGEGEVAAPEPVEAPKTVPNEVLAELKALAAKKGWDLNQVKEYAIKYFGRLPSQLSEAEFTLLQKAVKTMPPVDAIEKGLTEGDVP